MQKRTIIIIALAIVIIVSIVMTVMDNTSNNSAPTTINDYPSREADAALNLETTADGTRYVSDPDYTPEEQKPAILFIGDEEDSAAATPPQGATTNNTNTITNDAGTYTDYTADAARAAAQSGNAVLFFHASWCPTCRALDQSIKAAQLPANVSIFKVDYDSEGDLKKKYRVTRQHTLVKVDADLNEVESWYGLRNAQDLVSRL